MQSMHLRLPTLFRAAASTARNTTTTTTSTLLRTSTSTTPSLARIASARRTFASTAILAERPTQITLHGKTYDILEPPPYPYGAANWFKQSNRGLYGGATIRYGNNVSHKTETKTRRTWHPNVVHKNVFSAALNRKIRLRMTTRVLRTIDKVGGLDEYLLGEKESRIRELGVEGWRLRYAVMMSDWGRARMGEKAKALGVPEEVRAMRGWMKKAEFEKYVVESMPFEAPTDPEELERERRFREKEMDEYERKEYRKLKAKEEKEKRKAIWDAPEIQRLWDEIRGTRVLVAKGKTAKGREIQRVLVLKEARPIEDLIPEMVEEWTDLDDANVTEDSGVVAGLGEEAQEAQIPGIDPTKTAQQPTA